jgi:hypothetical protein
MLHLNLLQVILPTVLAVLIVALFLFVLFRDPCTLRDGIINHLGLATPPIRRDLLLALYVVVISSTEVPTAKVLRPRDMLAALAHLGSSRVGKASRAPIIVGISLIIVLLPRKGVVLIGPLLFRINSPSSHKRVALVVRLVSSAKEVVIELDLIGWLHN